MKNPVKSDPMKSPVKSPVKSNPVKSPVNNPGRQRRIRTCRANNPWRSPAKGKLLSLFLFALLVVAVFSVVGLLAGCSSAASDAPGDSDSSAASATGQGDTQGSGQNSEKQRVRVASLKGCTSIGLVDFMEEAQLDKTASDMRPLYDFNIVGTADEILPSLIRGETDIALLPANVASVVYNKTEGGVQVLDINTLGVLYVVSADTSISRVSDLAGKTLVMSGKGTVPDYIVQVLLAEEGIADRVSIEFKSEATEVAATLAADSDAVAILPEPYVSAVVAKLPELSRSISLGDAWREATGEELVTGVTVVRKAFAEEHPELVAEFAERHLSSVGNVNKDPGAAAPKVVELGIIDDVRIVESAIPNCNLVCLTGMECRGALSSYFETLFAQNPDSLGGAIPSDEFYYNGDNS